MPATIREPAVAGQFYPAGPEELERTVRGFIKDARVEPAPEAVQAIVAPHAGLMYSGATAGHAYARVQGKQPGRVILAGCSHRERIRGASVYAEGAFRTPLGDLPVDAAYAGALARKTGSASTSAHQFEHALELQLPFLVALFGAVPIVPVLFGPECTGWHQEVGRFMAETVGDTDLLVVSTDLSHYHAQPDANRLDQAAIDAVLSKDWQGFVSCIASGQGAMCGATAVAVGMSYALARGADTWRLLDYRTSGEASGDYDRVVGYAALSMER